MTPFVNGMELAREFYSQAVRPIMSRRFPRLRHSSALLGSGSEVIGYDDAVSAGHHWGPRVMLFLEQDDHTAAADELKRALVAALPYHFMGYSTNFSAPKTSEGDHGTQILQDISSGRVNHRVEILTLDGFMHDYLGIAAEQEPGAADWLSIPQQKLLSFTSGAVFHDELDIQRIRDRYSYFPQDLWLYLLACGWSRIGQDEHLAPRAGSIGDELGSAVIGGRLARSIILLCFLYERRYAPYPKWLGTAFAGLRCAKELAPVLRSLQAGDTWRGREQHLCAAYEVLNSMHNSRDLTKPVQPAVEDFHGRGFLVSNAWRYSEALLAEVKDTEVKAIAEQSLVESIDQFSDSTDLREAAKLRGKIADLYSF